MKTEYLAIPGFTHYRICKETKKVQSNYKNEWKDLKPDRSKILTLYNEGKRYVFSINRLLYAVEKDISLADIPRNILVAEQSGKLLLITRNSFVEHCKLNERRMAIRDRVDIRDQYLQGIHFAQLVLSAYDTGDYSQVIAEIWKHENYLRKYIRAKAIAVNKEKQDELISQVFDRTLKAITARTASILNLLGYMKIILRAIHSELLKEKKRLISYDDRFRHDCASY